MSDRTDMPSSRELRWPALVAIDEMSGSASVLAILDRVSDRLGLSEEQREVRDPDSPHALITVRLAEALADLWAAGAVEGAASGEVAITDVGRRLTENDVDSIPAQAEGEEQPGESEEKAGVMDYIWSILEWL